MDIFQFSYYVRIRNLNNGGHIFSVSERMNDYDGLIDTFQVEVMRYKVGEGEEAESLTKANCFK